MNAEDGRPPRGFSRWRCRATTHSPKAGKSKHLRHDTWNFRLETRPRFNRKSSKPELLQVFILLKTNWVAQQLIDFDREIFSKIVQCQNLISSNPDGIVPGCISNNTFVQFGRFPNHTAGNSVQLPSIDV